MFDDQNFTYPQKVAYLLHWGTCTNRYWCAFHMERSGYIHEWKGFIHSQYLERAEKLIEDYRDLNVVDFLFDAFNII